MIDSTFPAARYRLDFVVETPMRLPDYAGSALRGAFGHALKRAVCVTRETECKACALYRSCAYPAVFAPPAPEYHAAQKFSEIPAPYVIEPPPWGTRMLAPGATLTFHLVLIGTARKHLPVVVHAFTRAFARGVGPQDGTAHLVGVQCTDSDAGSMPVYDADAGRLIEHQATLPPLPALPERIALEFCTPLRLQREGRALRVHELAPARLLMGLVKRSALLSELHAAQALDLDFRDLAHRAEAVTDTRDLHWRDWGRYSSRQQREMKFGGVIGRWVLAGELAPFWPFLYWGQWLHVGKEATFGLGQYRLAAD
jgi:hypothetical protein